MATKSVKKKPKKKPPIKRRKKAAPKPRRKHAVKTRAKQRKKAAPKPRRKRVLRKPRKERLAIVREIAAVETLADVKREVEKETRGGFRTVQKGFVLLETFGYYVTVNALVPGKWATESTPVFDADGESEQYHLAVWRTKVRRTAREALDDYAQMVIDQGAYADVNELYFLILSGELVRVSEDHSLSLMKVWSGPNPPRRLRQWANKQARK